MAKYHIAGDGMAKPCKASVKSCPLGAGEVHGEFESPEAAQRWAERKLEVETMSTSLRTARIGRRVKSALAGEEGHWAVVTGSETRETAEALAESVTPETYDATLGAFRSMVQAGKGKAVFESINKLEKNATKFNDRVAMDVSSLRMAAASAPAGK